MNDNIEQLKKLYQGEENHADIDDLAKKIKTSSLFLNLLNHDAFKIIIRNYEAEIDKINRELQTNKDLFNNEDGRDRGKILHSRKQWIKDFLKIFVSSKVEYDYTQEKITSLLTDI